MGFSFEYELGVGLGVGFWFFAFVCSGLKAWTIWVQYLEQLGKESTA